MSSIVIAGDSSGSITLDAPAVSGTTVLTLPTTSGTLVVTGGAQTIEFADGTVSAPSITNSGDTNTGIYFPAADTIAFTEGGVESMRITDVGNVGIGITPTARLNVHNASSTGEIGRFSSAQGTGEIQLNLGFTTTNQLSTFYNMATGDGGLSTNVGSANLIFRTSSTERMRIDSGGNVGIGTSSPTYKTDIVGGANAVETTLLLLRSNFTGTNTGTTLAFANSTNPTAGSGRVELAGLRDTASGSSFVVRTADSAGTITERMRITSAGRVGIGTSSPVQLLDVQANTADYTARILQNSASGSCILTTSNSNGTDNTYLTGFSSSSGAIRIIIYTNGNIVNSNNSYGAYSDAKLKENIVDATPKLEDLCKVKVRQYNLKSDPDHKQIGVVAQELEEVFAGLIDETPDKDADGNNTGTFTKSVKYSVFVPMLIKAIQEQQAIITQLQADVAALKGAK